MKNSVVDNSMTFEESLQDPSLAHVREALLYIDKTPFSKLMPKKHEKSLLHIVESESNDLFDGNSNLPILKVITTILEQLTDDISSALALKLTQRIVETWEKLSMPAPKKKKVLATV